PTHAEQVPPPRAKNRPRGARTTRVGLDQPTKGTTMVPCPCAATMAPRSRAMPARSDHGVMPARNDHGAPPLRHLYVRECAASSKVELIQVPSASNLADGFTKGLNSINFARFRDATGAKYSALAEGAKEAMWLTPLLEELWEKSPRLVRIHEDNRGTLLLANNPVNHGKTKHISVRWHLMRECVENRDIALASVATEDQTADILTKALGKITHQKHTGGLGLHGNKKAAK
ncbi:MAG: hypothetical protein BJ554DRAFT_4289, partial [Olpidium bornovanus]